MALKTLGSLGTTTLSGQQWPGANAANSISDADIATIANAIINDASPPANLPGAFSRMGLLYVPNRGILKVLAGDWVCYDPSGWPILLADMAMPATLTATVASGTSGTPGTIVFTANVRALGWQVNTPISGTNIAAGALILSLSNDGLTVTANTTGIPSGTVTAGSYTHS